MFDDWDRNPYSKFNDMPMPNKKHSFGRFEADQKDSDNQNSAEKILVAATELFSRNSFSAVSIKEIASLSGVNSALISYYFGGKKKLYQEVLLTQAESLLTLQDGIRQMNVSPLQKLRNYVEQIAAMQVNHPYNLHLFYRELLSPQPMFEGYVKTKLYVVHQFMAELVDEAHEQGEIKAAVKPTHVAFTLESIIMFFFLTQAQVRDLGNFHQGGETSYLVEALESYLGMLS